MSWARFDDGYIDHPKILEAGPMAELLDMRAIIYSCRHETDGRITTSSLRRLGRDIPKVEAKAARLVEVGRWELDGDGWLVVDFLSYNPSKAQREAERVSNRTRQEVYRTRGLSESVKKRDGDQCRYCGRDVNWKDRRGEGGAVFEHVIPIVKGGGTTLDNLVVACRLCNTQKGGRTPSEAGMKLREPGEYLGSQPRYSGSGRESLATPIERCARCGKLEIDCVCLRAVGDTPNPKNEAAQ